MEIIDSIKKIDKIHSYPAKYTVESVVDYVDRFSKENDVIYDPFIGSGTTVLAANYLKRICFGSDINPIAILISKIKSLRVEESQFVTLMAFLKKIKVQYFDSGFNQNIKMHHYISIEHWFENEVISGLSSLKFIIESEQDALLSLFCKFILSSIINLVSNQESDTRYAAVKKQNLTRQLVFDLFEKKYISTLSILNKSSEYLFCTDKNKIILHNSKTASEVLGNNIASLIITSPPYPNTYDYYLYHKHRMLWLDYDFKSAMQSEIGSRREFSSLKRPASNFDQDIKEIFVDCDKILKNNGHAVIIIGDGKVKGEKYDSKQHTVNIALQIGWKLDSSCETELDETSRSFQQSFRTKGKKEYVLIFKKEGEENDN